MIPSNLCSLQLTSKRLPLFLIIFDLCSSVSGGMAFFDLLHCLTQAPFQQSKMNLIPTMCLFIIACINLGQEDFCILPIFLQSCCGVVSAMKIQAFFCTELKVITCLAIHEEKHTTVEAHLLLVEKSLLSL